MEKGQTQVHRKWLGPEAPQPLPALLLPPLRLQNHRPPLELVQPADSREPRVRLLPALLRHLLLLRCRGALEAESEGRSPPVPLGGSQSTPGIPSGKVRNG